MPRRRSNGTARRSFTHCGPDRHRNARRTAVGVTVGWVSFGLVSWSAKPGPGERARAGPDHRARGGRPTGRSIRIRQRSRRNGKTRAECVLDTQHGPRARDRGAAALLYCQNTRGSSQGGKKTSKRILQRLVRCIFHNNAIVIDAVRTRRIRAKQSTEQCGQFWKSFEGVPVVSVGYVSFPYDPA